MLEAQREFKTAHTHTHSGAKRKEQIIEDALFNYLLMKKGKKKRAKNDEKAQTPTGLSKQAKKKTGKELRARGVMR